MNQHAMEIGYATSFVLAWVFLAAVMGLALLAIGWVGRHLWSDMRRAYNLYVIQYWLKRMEAEGSRIFTKARQEDLNKMRFVLIPVEPTAEFLARASQNGVWQDNEVKNLYNDIVLEAQRSWK